MTNSWAELNSPRPAVEPTATETPSPETVANKARDPFKPFLVITSGFVAFIGSLMVLGAGTTTAPSDVPTAPLAIEVEVTAVAETPPATEAPTTLLPNTDEMAIHRLYVAAFGREPDTAGFNHWTSQLAAGQSLEDVAAGFANTDEFTAQFGTRPVPRQVIELLHQNLLGRAPTATEVEYWLAIEAEGLSMADLLVLFAQSPSS